MAKNKVYIDVVVDDKGTTKKVAVNAKNLSEQLESTGKNSREVDRNLKGVAKASSNTTKNFSKMAQGMTGTLVPAYAELAANIFAITAAFNFLKEAADLRVLQDSQIAYTGAVGIGMQSLTAKIQSASESMLSFKESAQAAAIGVASGLNSTQIEQLAEGASNVAKVLGRDVTDSFNRLVRGVTKAEPELLDELGITLRLDDAKKKYATTLGKTAQALTLYEQKQAVFNEVQGQLEEKMNRIARVADVQGNSIQKLQVAFDKVLKPVKEFITAIAEPVAEFFTENITSLVAALGLLSAPIFNRIIGGMEDWKTSAADAASASREAAESAIEELELLRGAQKSASIEQALDQSATNSAIIEGMKTGTKVSKQQIDMALTAAKNGYGAVKTMTEQQRVVYIKELERMKVGHGKFTRSVLRGIDRIKLNFKVATTAIATNWKKMTATMTNLTSKFVGVTDKLMRGLGILGIIMMIKDLAMQGIEMFVGADKEAEKFANTINSLRDAMEANNKEFEKFSKIQLEMRKNKVDGEFVLMEGSTLKGIEAYGNMVNSVTKNIIEMGAAIRDKAAAHKEEEAALVSAVVAESTAIEKSDVLKRFEEVEARKAKIRSDIQKELLDGKDYDKLRFTSFIDDRVNNRAEEQYKQEGLIITEAQKRIVENERELIALITRRQSLISSGSVGLDPEDTSISDIDINISRITKNLESLGRSDIPAKLKPVIDSMDSVNQVITDTAKAAQEPNAITKMLQSLVTKEADIEGAKTQFNELIDNLTSGIDAVGMGTTETGIKWKVLLNEIKTTGKITSEQEDSLNSLSKTLEALGGNAAVAARGYQEVMAQVQGIRNSRTQYSTSVTAPINTIRDLIAIEKDLAKNANVNKEVHEARVAAYERELAYLEEIHRLEVEFASRRLEAQLKLDRSNISTVGGIDVGSTSLMIEEAGRLNAVTLAQIDLEEAQAKLRDAESITDSKRDEKKIAQLRTEMEIRKVGLRDAQRNANSTSRILTSMTDALETSLTDGLMGLVQGTLTVKEAFANMAQSILQSIAKVITQMLVLRMVSTFLGAAAPAANAGTPFEGISSVNYSTSGSFRNGGISKPPRGYSNGGIASGSTLGYPAILHGTEAVVPLPNGNSIPVEMKGAGSQNNVTVNVTIDSNGNTSQTSDANGTMGQNIGNMVAAAVQRELLDQKRSGGILNPYGVA